MSTVTVYRVEATRGPRKGHGPYSASPGFDENYRAWDDRARALSIAPGFAAHRPAPHEEHRLGYIEPDEFCGFTSKRALRKWWSGGSLRLLCEPGFYALVAYDVPREHVRRGVYQAVFRKAEAVSRRVLCHRTLQPVPEEGLAA